MELRQLKTFYTLASTLNFTRAAEVQNYVPSTVTMQMKALEEELGVKLVDRLGKNVTLTDAGRTFLRYADNILSVVEEAQHAVKQSGELTGTVVISADETLCTYRLPAVLRQFRLCYPGIRLMFRPLANSNLKQSLREGDADIIFMLDEDKGETGFCGEKMLDEPFYLLVSPDHPLAAHTALAIEDFHGETFLLTEKGCSYRTFFDRSLSQRGMGGITELEFNSAEAIKQCAKIGMGIAILPEMAVIGEVNRGELVPLPWDLTATSFATQMFWHEEKWISPAIEAFLSLTRETFLKNNT
ncbi:LysR family transcriptional regulator [Paenibacillus sp. 28ISP30-2]|uniref:LysR family transcriptional regulator n=1 Tax=Paenibacillus sp. 23TSA30-6 TaxID=2546104 RepID=UPI001787F356|nr:LysR family transcriptional regulator [Paenibacillus sp. 23TSA30-6]MBE0336046.1 LysR family transcriptional regulator [Paenibacillus sp. 23TSA30-6]MBE0340828.1 LysR family transcriptional regulator [Paenibacillus sp. 28ISP30-2]